MTFYEDPGATQKAKLAGGAIGQGTGATSTSIDALNVVLDQGQKTISDAGQNN